MTFKEYSIQSRERIKNHLVSFMDEKRNENLPAIFKEQRLIDSLESFALRGKLIRGTLFLLMCEAFGTKINRETLNIACAIEIMHSSLLIQDDVIDNDLTRRGAKTIFAHYSDEGERIGAFDAYHYGISTAIVAADVAFFFAIELISSFNSPSLSALLKYYAHEVYLVSLAESADSIFGQTSIEPAKEDIYAVYKYKTARYTFSLPFEMAAIVSGGKGGQQKELGSLGELAGIIFQLKDDEIGLFGDEALIGKPVGSDIRENKKTLIRALLYEHADESDRQVLDTCFGNTKGGNDQTEIVRNIYKKYKIGNYIDKEIQQLMDRVWEMYNRLEIDAEYKSLVKELLEFNLSRSY